jgi:hypothetical protein
MREKTLSLVLFMVFALVLVLTVTNGVGIASDAGPAEMELKTAAAKKPAKFPHKKHQDSFGCGECHHTQTDGKQSPYVEDMEIKKCITCHNKEDMSNPKLNTLKVAAHGLCKDCHKKNKDTAPTKCSGCHLK